MSNTTTIGKWVAWTFIATAELLGLALASILQHIGMVSRSEIVDSMENHPLDFILRRLFYGAWSSFIFTGLIWIIYFLITGPMKIRLLETSKSKLFLIQWAIYFVLTAISLVVLVNMV
jgi:hypothetical protein